MTAAVGVARGPNTGTGTGRWVSGVLRALEFVAYPALAGAAFCVLCLGVITWLPAMAAMAHALHGWLTDRDGRCFVRVFTSFPGYWRRLWRHSLVSTVVIAVLAMNVAFLAATGGPVAFVLLTGQLGIGLALIPYHFALATVAAVAMEETPTLDPAELRRRAMLLAFGAPARGLGLLAAAVLAPVITFPIPLGPLLLGPSLPTLYALYLAKDGTHEPDSPAAGHRKLADWRPRCHRGDRPDQKHP